MRHLGVAERLGRAIQLLLLVAILFVLIGKILVWTTSWAEGWAAAIDQLLFLTLGVYGLLVGLHMGRTPFGIVSTLGGTFLLIAFFLPSFDSFPLAMLLAVIFVLVGSVFGRAGH